MTPAERNDLILSHVRLVQFVLSRFIHRGDVRRVGIEDVRQAAFVGLIKAADHYNQARGAFSTYAVNIIRREIFSILADQSRLIRVPRHVGAALIGSTGVAASKVSPHCLAAGERSLRIQSIHRPDDGDTTETTPAAREPDEADDDLSHRRAMLAEALRRYPPRTRLMFRLRMRGLNNAEIAERVGVSKERVRQVMSKAIGEIRAALPVVA